MQLLEIDGEILALPFLNIRCSEGVNFFFSLQRPILWNWIAKTSPPQNWTAQHYFADNFDFFKKGVLEEPDPVDGVELRSLVSEQPPAPASKSCSLLSIPSSFSESWRNKIYQNWNNNEYVIRWRVSVGRHFSQKSPVPVPVLPSLLKFDSKSLNTKTNFIQLNKFIGWRMFSINFPSKTSKNDYWYFHKKSSIFIIFLGQRSFYQWLDFHLSSHLPIFSSNFFSHQNK